eukprot:5687648-Prymnesium_polylepis.1
MTIASAQGALLTWCMFSIVRCRPTDRCGAVGGCGYGVTTVAPATITSPHVCRLSPGDTRGVVSALPLKVTLQSAN